MFGIGKGPESSANIEADIRQGMQNWQKTSHLVRVLVCRVCASLGVAYETRSSRSTNRTRKI